MTRLALILYFALALTLCAQMPPTLPAIVKSPKSKAQSAVAPKPVTMTYLSWVDPNTNGVTGLQVTTNLACPHWQVAFEMPAPDCGLVTFDYTNAGPCAYFRAFNSLTNL